MNNYSYITFPAIVFEAFPILKELVYIRPFASLVPLSPDTIFHLFGDKAGRLFALVMTDHTDPAKQSQELKQVSGKYAFEFIELIKPYTNDEYSNIKEHEEILENPVILDADSHYYFYVANLNPAV